MNITYSKKIFCLLFSSFLLFAIVSNAHPAGLCTGENATLDCLKKNSFELYSQNMDLFWSILNKAANEAHKCNNNKSTADFLKLVQITRDGALAEYFSEHIENLCRSNTKCFLDALLLLDPFDQDRLIYELYIPTFTESTEITDALSKYKSNVKYKRIIDLYMKKFKPKDN
jgi:hypothetical protein